jgi:hypothetical protein
MLAERLRLKEVDRAEALPGRTQGHRSKLSHNILFKNFPPQVHKTNLANTKKVLIADVG